MTWNTDVLEWVMSQQIINQGSHLEYRIVPKRTNTSQSNISGKSTDLACSSFGEQNLKCIKSTRSRCSHLEFKIVLKYNKTSLGVFLAILVIFAYNNMKRRNWQCLCQSEAKVAIYDYESLQKDTTHLEGHKRNIFGKSGECGACSGS